MELEPNLNSSRWQKDPGPTSNSFKSISLELGDVSIRFHTSTWMGPRMYDTIGITDAMSLPEVPAPYSGVFICFNQLAIGHWINKKQDDSISLDQMM